MDNVAFFVAGLFLGVPFIIWGYLKLRGGEAKLVPFLVALGLPDATVLAYLVGLCEFVGGLAVVIGYPARLAAILLGLWCPVTGSQAHIGDTNALMSHVTMAGGFFLLAIAATGTLALFGGVPPGHFGDI